MKFYVWEGMDGSGKTTAIRNTYKELRKRLPPERRVVLLEEPGKMGFCGDIRNLIMDGRSEDKKAKMLLFQASRAAMTAALVNTFTKDEIVLCDRFTPSTISYQGYGMEMDLNFLEELNKFSSNGVEPEKIFYLSISPEMARLRKNPENYWDRFDLDFYAKVDHGYAMQYLDDRDERWIRIDAELPKDEIANFCVAEILLNE